jgi:hypothetical protein
MMSSRARATAVAVDFYGSVEDAKDIERLKGPLLPLLAPRDERMSPWAFQGLLTAAMKYEKGFEVHIYPNTLHAFHRPRRPSHNGQAALDAWRRVLDFLASRLNSSGLELSAYGQRKGEPGAGDTALRLRERRKGICPAALQLDRAEDHGCVR